ncbi:MAG: ABC transporter substrate-binding protein [Proteobacteria bacterium]|nr:ABC transporter substrate-binding protein [Pseudomonadota bacterium]
MKIHRFAILLLAVFATTQTIMAAPYQSVQQGPWQAPTDNKFDSTPPDAILRAGVTKLTNFIKSGRAQNQEQALAFMATEIEPYFDFGYMTRWAAGPAWRNMSPQQRAGMEEQLKSSFMNTLAQKLVTYTDQPIRYFTPRGQDSNDVRVNAWIMQPNGIPTRLEFRFYQGRNGWKIFDVKAEGSSAVVYYRKQFKHLLQPEHRSPYYY